MSLDQPRSTFNMEYYSQGGQEQSHLARVYLMRALMLVEKKLDRLHRRYSNYSELKDLSVITAGIDPESPVWADVLQVAYLENAREGLISTLYALRQPHGRVQ